MHLYHNLEVKEVELCLVQVQEGWETSPIKIFARKCGIILFFTFFEGICGLQASKVRMSASCTKETHRYKKNSCFLSDFDEGSWDFD